MKLYVFSIIAAMASQQASADLSIDPSTCTLACGSSSNRCRGQSVPADVAETHPVRCCSDVEKPGWTYRPRCGIWSQTEIDGGCHDDVTFVEAVTICAKAGGRICSKDELLNDCTRGSGCGKNAGFIWSSDPWEPCTSNADCQDGLECTTNTCGDDGICDAEFIPDCLIVTGCGTKTAKQCDGLQRKADPGGFHFRHVRCCADPGTPGFMENPACPTGAWGASEVGPVGEECLYLKTYDEAVAACVDAGGRLCTADELLNDCTAGTGCGLDGKVNWSATIYDGK